MAQEVASAKVSGRWQGAVGTLGVIGVLGAAYGVVKLDFLNLATRSRNLLAGEPIPSVIDEDSATAEDMPSV